MIEDKDLRVALMQGGIEPHPLDEAMPGGVVINPHSALGKELRKWEQFPSELTPRGTRPGNPYTFREYPKMLYKAVRHPRTGQPVVLAAAPQPWDFERQELYERAQLLTDTINRQNVMVVPDEAAERLAVGQGWSLSQQAALDLFEKQQINIAELAARANADVQRMSDKAKAEKAAADASSSEHVVDLVGSSAKRTRGRPRKATPVTPAGELG